LAAGTEAFAFSEGVFVQSNASLLDTLAAAVCEAAGTGGLAFDLFAGAGFLTLGLARRFEKLIAVESNQRAVDDLRFNLHHAGIDNTRSIAEPLEEVIAPGQLDGLQPDVIVLDPPRAGLPGDTAEQLAALEPERFVYLSCDPATLARDLSVLAFHGYRLESARAFDLFPQTPHVEVLAVAVRDSPLGA
jgi:tRNA/tmRNA/rRNA uracil-C5-methylase (TrmA/RlmC/RlmD family)